MSDFKNYFQEGIKSSRFHKIGLELELFLFHRASFQRVTYDEYQGLAHVLNRFLPLGWEGVYEKGLLLGAKKEGSTLTLEPGGQLEFSGAPHTCLHKVFNDLTRYLSELNSITNELDICPIALGYDPVSDHVPFIPKPRYTHMASYWRKHNPISLEMMLKTASIQVSLDYSSEEDMALKVSTVATLQPLVAALFQNSPIRKRRPSGFLGYRNHIWTQMESVRTGTPRFMRNPRFTFQDYVDYLLDAPMFFISQGDTFLDAHGKSFRSHYLADNKPSEFLHEAWVYHTSTIFPDVRVKQFIEIRGTDALPYDEIMAPAAFWTGILYEHSVLNKAAQIADSLSPNDWEHLQTVTPQSGMETLLKGKPIIGMIKDLLALSEEGLDLRHKANPTWDNESLFLKPTKRRLEQTDPVKRSLAQQLLSQWSELSQNKDQDLFLDGSRSVSPFS